MPFFNAKNKKTDGFTKTKPEHFTYYHSKDVCVILNERKI